MSSFKVCRVCLKTEEETLLLSLLKGNGKKAEMFEAISGIDISLDVSLKNSIMICKDKCFKDLETAFILRSQMTHVENSYFQLRRDENEDELESMPQEETISFKTEKTEERFSIQVTNTLRDDDPLSDDSASMKDSNYHKNTSDEEYKPKTYSIKHKPGKNKNFACEICSKRMNTKYNLEQHLLRHIKNPKSEVKNIHADTSDNTRPFKCDECGRFFKTLAALNQHAIIHTDIRPFVCECGKAFRRNDHLKGHKMTHEKNKDL